MDEMNTTLQEKIDAFNAGMPNARDELLSEAANPLRALLARIFHQDFARLKQQHETGDLFGELYVRLIPRIEAQKFNDEAHFMNWSARDIRYLLLDLIRRQDGRGRRPTVTTEESSSDCQLDPADDTHDPARMLFWQAFLEGVEQLPMDQREVFDMHWFQGKTLVEVSVLLGVPYKTVKDRWRDARINLMRQLPSGGPTNWDSSAL